MILKTLLFGYFEICAYNARTKTTLKSEKHNVFIVKKIKLQCIKVMIKKYNMMIQ